MKMKTLVLIGIAVCVILLTSPVLTSAGYSKIYGNANEDDVLDMRDVTYIKLVIFGKKPATTLADANYDGKISMLDLGQTKLIILGKEKQLTLVDEVGFDRVVTIPRPVERVVSLIPEATRVIIALGDADKLVGIDSSSLMYFNSEEYTAFAKAYPEGKELPDVGGITEPNLELIVSLEPDVIFGGWSYSSEAADSTQEKTGIPVVCVYTRKTMENLTTEIEIIGKVIEQEKEAEELISYFKEKIDKVTEVTSEIPESEKPKVYLAFWSELTKTPVVYEPLDIAGGINAAGECAPGGSGWLPLAMGTEVSIEQIIEWNPDIILIMHGSKKSTPTIEDVLSDPRLQTINAVKNRKVYYTLGMCSGWDHPRVFTEMLYMAKRSHPDKFEDLDVEKEGNEIFERFYGVDGLWTEFATNIGFI